MNKSIRRTIGFGLGILLTVALTLISVIAAEPQTYAPAGERLDANTQKLYEQLKEDISRIANGDQASAKLQFDTDTLDLWGIKLVWTAEELGVDTVTKADVDRAMDLFWEQFDGLDQILDALLHDCPYELYWFDKTEGMKKQCEVSYLTSVTITSVEYRFAVSADYRTAEYDAESPTVDTAKTKAAANAVAYAEQIVARHASLSDYDKLMAYKEEICQLVAYHDDAAMGSYEYGNPWQIIYVFDRDDGTNVVCEGYAKAFQYLCNLSDFSKDVTCYTVSGNMIGGTGAGAHMWNIVTMGDEAYYLVDVTNSDDGAIGEGGELFLAGYDRSVSNGYAFNVSTSEISFQYDQETLAFWGVDEDSILYINEGDYEAPTIEVLIPDQIVYTGEALTVGEENTDIIYRGSATVIDTYFNWSYTWYLGDRELNEAPKDAGTYQLKVKAVNIQNPLETYSVTQTVTIERATPDCHAPTGLMATYGDTLADIVLPDGFSWSHALNTSVGNAGEQQFYIIFTPADTQNYDVVTDIPVSITVKKAIPTYHAPSALHAYYGDVLLNIKLPEGFSWQSVDNTLRVASVGKHTFYVVYTPSDLMNYEIVRDIGVELSVSKCNIQEAVITLGDPLFFTGDVQTQSIQSVKVDGMDVTYTVTGNTAKEVGVYTLTVTGTGNFEGTATTRWTIAQKPPVQNGGQDAPLQNSTDPIVWIAVGVGGAVLLITIVVIVCVAKKKK